MNRRIGSRPNQIVKINKISNNRTKGTTPVSPVQSVQPTQPVQPAQLGTGLHGAQRVGRNQINKINQINNQIYRQNTSTATNYSTGGPTTNSLVTGANQPMLTWIEINNTYILGKKLGQGSFGDVYQGTHKQTKDPVAIKLEPLSSKNKILSHEYQVYQDVYKPDCGLCQCYHYGVEGDFSVLVIDILGPSLTELFNLCNKQFSLKTVLMIADQLISRIEYLHDHNYIHRDLKSDNFLIGTGYNQNKIYMIDYGLAKRYRMGDKHISFKTGNKLIGTARYASINSHKGVRLSRRDDMESLGYILIFFLKGVLPWQSMRGKDKTDKYYNIMKRKETVGLDQLCMGLPEEFRLYMEHVRSLEFTEKPNYKYLRYLFTNLFQKENFVYDLVFDWCDKI